jgi:coenzyme F420-0:L-glutamate ligase/coenzyme F420-1:gamma-L-glutamate ligase
MKARPDDQIEIIALRTLPEIHRHDDLAQRVVDAARREGVEIADGDVIVLTQKIVSKAEGRLVDLRDVEPSPLARDWARRRRVEPRFMEVVLRESRRVVRMSERALIAETHHGFVCANAGVDRSNVPGRHWATCLPRDPDASARRFIRGVRRLCGARAAAIISDTFGRPWRLGLTNVAIGAAGLRVLEDWRGKKDAHGHTLQATIIAVADELAAAAGLAMGKTRKVPVVIVRGYRYRRGNDGARRLIRPEKEDLFR